MVKKEVGSDKKWNAHIKVLYCFRKKKIDSDKCYADLAEKVWYKIAHRQEILLTMLPSEFKLVFMTSSCKSLMSFVVSTFKIQSNLYF